MTSICAIAGGSRGVSKAWLAQPETNRTPNTDPNRLR